MSDKRKAARASVFRLPIITTAEGLQTEKIATDFVTAPTGLLPLSG